MGKMIVTAMLLLFASITNAQDSILVCQGIRTYFLGSGDRTHQMNVVISKDSDGKITKVVIDNDETQTFTLQKTDLRYLKNEHMKKLGIDVSGLNSPMLVQLIVDNDNRIILRAYNSDTKNPFSDHTIQNTGAYELHYFTNHVKGQCVARDKVF